MTDEGPGVDVHVNAVGPWEIPGALLERGCRAALEDEGVYHGEISIALLGDEGIQSMNQEYFGRAWATDVIAFALHGPQDPVLGDIYLGYEQARRQASEFTIPLDEELLRLVIHGTLHVLGHDHPEGEERGESEMFRRQEMLLARVLSQGHSG